MKLYLVFDKQRNEEDILQVFDVSDISILRYNVIKFLRQVA